MFCFHIFFSIYSGWHKKKHTMSSVCCHQRPWLKYSGMGGTLVLSLIFFSTIFFLSQLYKYIILLIQSLHLYLKRSLADLCKFSFWRAYGSNLSDLSLLLQPTLDFYKNGKKETTIVGADVAKLKNTMESLYR